MSESAAAVVKATCKWVPAGGEGEGPPGPPPHVIIGTGTATAIAQGGGTYWNTAEGSNVLAIGSSAQVKAFKGQGEPADSTWSCTGGLSRQPEEGVSTTATAIEASTNAWDSNVRSVSRDNQDLFDDEPFTVVKVVSIAAEPDVVCVGNSNIAYTITTQPTGFEFMVQYTPADVSTPGVKQVLATCGTSSATCTVTIVGVAKVICGDVESTTAEPGTNETVVVLQGEEGATVSLTAVAEPEGQWPEGCPEWTGGAVVPNAQEPWNACFPIDVPGTYTVYASCGASRVGIIIKVETGGGGEEVKVDLVFERLPEESEAPPNELEPGGFVMLNDNDNAGGEAPGEGNGTKDLDDPVPLPHADPDLKVLELSITPAPTSGVATLTVPGVVRLWTDAKKTQQQTVLSWEFPSQTMPAMLYVEGYSLGSGEMTLSYSGEGEGSDTVKVTVFEVDSLSVIPKGWPEGEELPSVISIASGAIESDAHQAEVRIRIQPPAGGASVPVRLLDGLGHEMGKDAKLTMGLVVATGGGEEVCVETCEGGVIEGVLTSSDVINNCRIQAGKKETTVNFSWDNFEEEGEWTTSPEYLPEEGVVTNYLTLRHHRMDAEAENPWMPLDRHEIRFFVEQVEYWEDGLLKTTNNTPENPGDLSAWAHFPEESYTTDADGKVEALLTVEKQTNLWSVVMVAYDWTVYKEPAERESVGMLRLEAGKSGQADERGKHVNRAQGDQSIIIRKIPLGGSTNLNNMAIGKVYIPTKNGGSNTLSGAEIDLFYTDGSDLDGTTAWKIANGELGDKLVASGNPCRYDVPAGKFGWYYVRVSSETDVSVTSLFQEHGCAAQIPWQGYYWPTCNEVNPNLYDDGYSLNKYDQVWGTTSQVWEIDNHSGGLDWEGHCWGMAVASVLTNQPQATTKNGIQFTEEEMEGLYIELANCDAWTYENYFITGMPYQVTTNIGEAIDACVDEFHKILQEVIGGQKKPLVGNLRDAGGGDPDIVQNHAIYQYQSRMEEMPGENNEKAIRVYTFLWSKPNAYYPSSGSPARRDVYIFDVFFNAAGKIDGLHPKQNWRSASGFPPAHIKWIERSDWTADNPEIKLYHVEALYE